MPARRARALRHQRPAPGRSNAQIDRATPRGRGECLRASAGAPHRIARAQPPPGVRASSPISIGEMVMRPSASWRAASSRARLKEPRRRLPANATTRRTSFNACSAMPASSTQERERLGAFHARLEVFAYRQHLLARQRLHDVPLETHNRHLAGPARRVFHLGPPDECHRPSLRCSRTACQQYHAATVR